MLAGKIQLSESQVTAHTKCLLGQWYYKRGQIDFGGRQEFVDIEAPHTRLHAVVREAVRASHAGDRVGAERGLKETERLSKEIVAALDRLEKVYAGRPKAIRGESVLTVYAR